MFSDTKGMFASKTVWGGALVLIAIGLELAGFTFTAADQAETMSIFTKGMELVGGVLAIYGRVTATKKIG